LGGRSLTGVPDSVVVFIHLAGIEDDAAVVLVVPDAVVVVVGIARISRAPAVAVDLVGVEHRWTVVFRVGDAISVPIPGLSAAFGILAVPANLARIITTVPEADASVITPTTGRGLFIAVSNAAVVGRRGLSSALVTAPTAAIAHDAEIEFLEDRVEAVLEALVLTGLGIR
jgi:hypothetical protein